VGYKDECLSSDDKLVEGDSSQSSHV